MTWIIFLSFISSTYQGQLRTYTSKTTDAVAWHKGSKTIETTALSHVVLCSGGFWNVLDSMSRNFRAKKCCCKDLHCEVAFHHVISEELSMGSKCIRVMAVICDARARSSLCWNIVNFPQGNITCPVFFSSGRSWVRHIDMWAVWRMQEWFQMCREDICKGLLWFCHHPKRKYWKREPFPVEFAYTRWVTSGAATLAKNKKWKMEQFLLWFAAREGGLLRGVRPLCIEIYNENKGRPSHYLLKKTVFYLYPPPSHYISKHWCCSSAASA